MSRSGGKATIAPASYDVSTFRGDGGGARPRSLLRVDYVSTFREDSPGDEIRSQLKVSAAWRRGPLVVTQTGRVAPATTGEDLSGRDPAVAQGATRDGSQATDRSEGGCAHRCASRSTRRHQQ